MKKIKLVIGANFGDEGKGLMTDYFADKARERKENCIVVCHNGGAQRGHTVTTKEQGSHIFHQFGAGSFAKADTYFSEDFLLNPMVFHKEWRELEKKEIFPICYAREDCTITLPYDMLVNQILERSRGNQKHGSCGMGILETVIRNKKGISFSLAKLYQPFDILKKDLKHIQKEYIPNRLEELLIKEIQKEEKEILENDMIIENFIQDCKFMIEKIKLTTDKILNCYENIIFEGAQGLLLDQDNKEYMPHLTPSSTGIKNPHKIIRSLWKEEIENKERLQVEACYVSRTYLTRHGAGRLDRECRKEDINPQMIDKTNQYNTYQGNLRYGKIEKDELKKRIKTDCQNTKIPMNISLAFTHLNETDGKLAEAEGEKNIKEEEWGMKIYTSDNRDRKSVREKRVL